MQKTEKKSLQFAVSSCILCIAVTLIALKREVAADSNRRFSVERMSNNSGDKSLYNIICK